MSETTKYQCALYGLMTNGSNTASDGHPASGTARVTNLTQER